MNKNVDNTALLEPPLATGSLEVLLPEARGSLVGLSQEYLATILNGHDGTPQEMHPLFLAMATAVPLVQDPELRGFGNTSYVEVPLAQQLDYVDKVRELLGEQATFGLRPIDLEGDEQNLLWLQTIVEGDWPIALGTSLELHDRGNHHDSLTYAPPEQGLLITIAAGFALAARKAGKDIIIPKRYGGSKRGETFDSNFLGHLDSVTEGQGSLSPQTKGLLRPLLDQTQDFSEAIQTNTERLLIDVDDFLTRKTPQIGADLALSLGCLETITLATQNRNASSDEIKIALYEVIKGYIKSAAKLRGEPVPEGALDFWPSDEQGAPMTMTMEELLFEIGGGDRTTIDPRLQESQ